MGLNNLLASEFVVPEATQGTSIDEKKLGEIVKHAVAVQLENSTAAPTYEAVAVRLPTVSQEKTQAQAPQIQNNYRAGIKTSEGTKRRLQSRAPREYGVRVDKIVATFGRT